MPELPEVEHIRRTLFDRIHGMWVNRVRVDRPDVIRRPTPGSRRSNALLSGGRINALHRHGKRLAIEVEDGRVLEFGLGMSGQFILEPITMRAAEHSHRHVTWLLGTMKQTSMMRLSWRDPRRFGGLFPMPSMEALMANSWDHLGPDALKITPAELLRRLQATKRLIKTSILDQHVLAGVGNIYADEGLHAARIKPLRESRTLTHEEVRTLLRCLKAILRQAVEMGGSTIRDHQDPMNQPGAYQARHAVYGRPGAPCTSCGRLILTEVLGGRTTHWCPGCQR